MSCWALVMAAGSGSRMGLKANKALMPLNGLTMLERSAKAFDGLVDGMIIVASEKDRPAVEALRLGIPIAIGGDTRQRSVLNGLMALPREAEIVLIHDAARPFVTRDTILRCKKSAQEFGSGVASVPVKDTIKQIGPEGSIQTLSREALGAAQTPQAFRVATLRGCIEALEQQGITATDDAAAMEAAGKSVRLVEGSYENIKVTTPEDMKFAQWILGGYEKPGIPRVGQGYDAHRLVPGRPLILCGVEIPFERGLLGHSDADVACHALMDALLGAAALGDIGTHFPDSDPRYKGISSMLLLERTAEMLRERAFSVVNVDVTIIAQWPKLKPFIPRMAEALAGTLSLPTAFVNVKATTTEEMGFEGEGLGMSAYAVAMLMGRG